MKLTRISFFCLAIGGAVAAQSQLVLSGQTYLLGTHPAITQSGTSMSLDYGITSNGITPGTAYWTFKDATRNFAVDRNYVGSASIFWSAYLFLQVGNIPVRMSDPRVEANYKFVLGGGSSTNPIAESYMNSVIYEYEDLNSNGSWEFSEPYYGFVLPIDQELGSLTGNGLQTVNKSHTYNGSYILGANRSYMIFMGHTLKVTQSPLSFSDPTAVVTMEFPEPDYDGIRFSTNFVAVPEPATLAALGLGLAAVLRRRRS